jgi:hypothetical protein
MLFSVIFLHESEMAFEGEQKKSDEKWKKRAMGKCKMKNDELHQSWAKAKSAHLFASIKFLLTWWTMKEGNWIRYLMLFWTVFSGFDGIKKRVGGGGLLHCRMISWTVRILDQVSKTMKVVATKTVDIFKSTELLLSFLLSFIE